MTTTQTTYDVVIPVKNGSSFILEALDSVESQTLVAANVLVINDHSTDHTVSLVEKFFPRATIINSAGHGPAHALNCGLTHSASEFVAFLDHDDFWALNKQELQMLHLLQSPNLHYVHSGVRNFGLNKEGTLMSREFLDSRLLGACTFRKKTFTDFGLFNTDKEKDIFFYEFFRRIKNLESCATNTIELHRRIHSDNFWIKEKETMNKGLLRWLRDTRP